MALHHANQGARRTGQTITWKRVDNTYQDLTGATLTGVIRNVVTGGEQAVDGTLTVVDAPSGVFSWAYGVGDVATAGVFKVQFKATYGSLYDLADIVADWEVREAL